MHVIMASTCLLLNSPHNILQQSIFKREMAKRKQKVIMLEMKLKSDKMKL